MGFANEQKTELFAYSLKLNGLLTIGRRRGWINGYAPEKKISEQNSIINVIDTNAVYKRNAKTTHKEKGQPITERHEMKMKERKKPKLINK